MNRVILIGNLGQDPELKELGGDKAVCKFSLATQDGWGDNKKTNWHRIVCWNKTAEIAAKFLAKGSKVAIEGEIQYGSYENKDGVTVYTTDIICSKLEFIESKKQDQSQGDVQSGEGLKNFAPNFTGDEELNF